MGRVTGSLTVVQRKTGPVYFIMARDRDGRQIKKRVGPVDEWPRRLAEDALRDFLTDLGRVPDRGDPSVTVKYAVTAWLRYVEHDKGREPSTVRDYRNTMNRQIVGRYKDRPLSEITVEDLEQLRAELLDTLSRRTAQKTLVLLTACTGSRFARTGSRRTWSPRSSRLPSSGGPSSRSSHPPRWRRSHGRPPTS